MLSNSLLLAVREIRRNALRSFLTILGIVIGVAAVIVMVTLGEGATLQVRRQIEGLGSNLLIVVPGQRMGPGMRQDAPAFALEDIEALRRSVPALAAVAPAVTQSATAIVGNRNWSTSVTGSDNSYLQARAWTLAAGRAFTEGELRAGKAVCLLGDTVRRELFGRQDPLGQRVRLTKLSCEVIGLLQPKGQSGMGRDQDDLVLLPLRTVQRRLSGNQDVAVIYLSVHAERSMQRAKADVEHLLRERRHISASEEDNFSVRDMREIASMLTGTTQVLTALLGAVASVSLLVGGIGIMNIMLVSVTERTREIGIRLAIGAREREVLSQFLVEAVVLSSFGGLLGILLALAASLLLARVLQVPFVLNLGIIGLAFLFSAAVGILFGFFPARRAARLDPIEALRRE
ncbi:FtsX-like permease family protein [Thiohalocapsa marina]|uniref:FtsX-like permease family protein n=1 Tax=Thiohalocapsa marina TaxID=424902 RepID=A0A5M8FP65_9GAMM|nr:ABC transporter permease [Thiohalocapsa marina]KAA6186274.1 FtsX-like permease family protein [Thiohalocapsa marina]